VVAFKTLDQLVQDTIVLMSQVPGTSVQVYSEDRIAQQITRSFYQLAREPGYWWPWLCDWWTTQGDGTTGKPIIDFTANNICTQFGDIRAFYADQDQRPLPILPSNVNPFISMAGWPIYIQPGKDVPTNMFKIWPVTSTTLVRFYARYLPPLITALDIVPFDDLILTNHAAFKEATSDGANPGEGQLFLADFNKTFKNVKASYDSQPIDMDSRYPQAVWNWWEQTG
jgi:hypothetical protein